MYWLRQRTVLILRKNPYRRASREAIGTPTDTGGTPPSGGSDR